MTDDDRPTPPGFEVSESDSRPGEPLYPKGGEVANRDGDPVEVGDRLRVWYRSWSDGYGEAVLSGEVLVIEDESDIFAVPTGEPPEDVSRLYRIGPDLDSIQIRYVEKVPRYDPEDEVYTVTATVASYGSTPQPIVEVRTHGREKPWGQV